MPLCVSWESLLKGGLLPFLKETALPNPSLRRGIALLPETLPRQERTLSELQPTQPPELQPCGLMPRQGCPPEGSWEPGCPVLPRRLVTRGAN